MSLVHLDGSWRSKSLSCAVSPRMIPLSVEVVRGSSKLIVVGDEVLDDFPHDSVAFDGDAGFVDMVEGVTGGSMTEWSVRNLISLPLLF